MDSCLVQERRAALRSPESLLKNSLAYFRECMCSVVNATCKQNIFSEHDFKRGPISADNVKASLDRLEAKNAMECLVKDGPGAFLDTIDGPITNGKYFDCSVDLLWSCNPSLSTSQYFPYGDCIE